jgi:site-specific DNA recombinase
MHIALYARVSTTRQAENDLSIPDQLRQMRLWAERLGHVVVREYIEPGASATDDKRPVFQDMMSDAGLKPAPFQAVVVHSLSRFFRDLVLAAMYERKLQKAGVSLVSITQQMQNDNSGEMQRRMIMLFDEYQSKETAKHVLRGMQENARQGYFNGSKAPYGYKAIDAGQTGSRGRMKKKLAINPVEAEVVHEIYELYVNGINGPRMGMKDIAKTLNAKGTLARGKLWAVQRIHEILSSTTYCGWYAFNRRDSKTFKIKDEADWVKTAVPAIIEQELSDKASKLREAWSPTKCAPRRETSPNLLMGLLKCGHCSASMSVVTGKGGRYRYYKCNARIRKGEMACTSKSYPLEKIDALVLDTFKQQVYTPEHIRTIIDELRHSLAKNKDTDGQQRLKTLESELKDTEQAQARLFDAVEKGILDLDDKLTERAKQHKETRATLLVQIADLKRQYQTPLQTLTPQKIEAVSRILLKRLSVPSAYSRAYLKASLTEIQITDEKLRLSGSSSSMAELIAGNGAIAAQQAVPNFIPKWCARQDSNL